MSVHDRRGKMVINTVFLFVPNLITYARFLCYLVGFLVHVFGNWQWCVILYSVGFMGDVWDGMAARKLNQSSKLGAALDMLADRVATTGLCVILAQQYPRYTLIFILLIALDITSHYFLVYLAALQGEGSHKNFASQSEYRLLRLYYGNRYVLTAFVTGNEVVYIVLYIFSYTFGTSMAWFNGEWSMWHILLLVSLPFYVLKQLTNILQLTSSIRQIARIDAEAYLETQR